MLCENFKEKNKNSIHSELPKIGMLPKKQFKLVLYRLNDDLL